MIVRVRDETDDVHRGQADVPQAVRVEIKGTQRPESVELQAEANRRLRLALRWDVKELLNCWKGLKPDRNGFIRVHPRALIPLLERVIAALGTDEPER